MSTQQSAYTYFGLWINWSHGMIRGSTLTLSSRDGSLLTAFLALFVAVAGSALWRIVAFLFHQLGARRGRKDGMHHQQQVILRNTGSPGSALWQFTQLVYYWWQPAERPVWRSLPFLVLALLSLAVLSVTSLFSSQITRASGAETLIISNNCGFWVPDVDSVEQSNRAFAHKTLRDSTSAASYAQACYGSNPDTLQCNQYVQRQIKWTANQNATCPFGSGICMISDTAAYEMDSGLIDSHVHLGINTPKKNRITYRKRTTCAALNKDDYFTTKNATETTTPEGGFFGQPGDVINFYNFGSFEGLNYTFFYNTHAAIDGHGYDLTSVPYYGGRPNDGFAPVKALRRDDADVSIMFMTPNSITYGDVVHDPFFAADLNRRSVNVDGQNITFYLSNYYVNVMACIDQHQFCNPNNNQCTDFTSSALSGTQAGSIGMNSVQDVIVGRLSLQLALISTYGNIGGRGGSALRAQELVHDLQSDPIPNDQWMVEVGSWFNTGLAKLQRAMVEFASGPADVIDGAHVQKPPGIIAESLCHSQMVHSPSGTMGFSVLGLALVLIIGSILILTYLILDTVVGYLQRKFEIGRHRRIKWILDENLQLQRLAYEAAEMGNWSGGTAAVPVTKSGETFELPSNIDQDHPKLQYSRIAEASVTVHQLREEEDTLPRTEIRLA